MDIRLRLTDDEADELRLFSAQVGRSADDIVTGAARRWLDHRRELATYVDRIVNEDAELLRRLADS